MDSALKNYLAYSRMLPIADRDGREYLFITDARARHDHEDGTLGMGELKSAEEQDAARTYLLFTGGDIHRILTKENVPAIEDGTHRNMRGMDTYADTKLPSELFGPGLENIIFSHLRMATYNFDMLSVASEKLTNALHGTVLRDEFLSRELDSVHNQPLGNTFSSMEYENKLSKFITQMLNESKNPENENYEYYREFKKQTYYNNLIEKVENNYNYGWFDEDRGQNDITKAFTNCNTLMRVYGITYNHESVTGVSDLELGTTILALFAQ
jgi:hypothetical protein